MLFRVGQYSMNILVAIDILGNTICDGSRWHTISARTGYFAFSPSAATHPVPWRVLACIIDFSFLPWQGWGHCRKAWKAEATIVKPPRFQMGFALVTALLAIPITVFCPPIFVVGCLAWALRVNKNNQPAGKYTVTNINGENN